MKTIIIKSVQILMIVFFLSLSYNLTAQGPPAPPDSGTSNNDGNKLNGDGGGAPIGGGLFILLALGAAYGGRKLYKLNKESE